MKFKLSKNLIVNRVIIMTLLMSIINTASIIHANENTKQQSSISLYSLSSYKYSDSVEENLDFVADQLPLFKSSNNIGVILTITSVFAEIGKNATSDDLLNVGKGSRVYSIFIELRDVIYAMENESDKSMVIADFAENIYQYWCRNLESDIFPELYLIEGLVEYNKNLVDKSESLQKSLDVIQMSYEYSKENKEETSEKAEERDEYEKDLNESQFTTTVNKEKYSYTEEYKVIGDRCILVELRYKNGYFFEQVEKEVEKSDYINCGITDYIHGDIDVVINENIPNSSEAKNDEYLYENQNETSSLYVFYTVNKDENEPYFYNTGIKADDYGILTYKQLRDTLQQIIFKIKGFYTETDEKTLFIFEGRPLVLNSYQLNYTKEEVIGTLSDYKSLGLDIDTEKVQMYKSSMEKAIDDEGNFAIIFNDVETILTGAHLYDNGVMIPIVETIALLGYDVDIDEEDSNIMIVKIKADEESDNNESEVVGILDLKEKTFTDMEEYIYDLSVSTKNNEWYAEINSFLGAFNYEGDYYSDLEAVVITEIAETTK